MADTNTAPPAQTIPEGKVSLKDIPVESNKFVPPVKPQSLQEIDQTTPPADTPPPADQPPADTPPPPVAIVDAPAGTQAPAAPAPAAPEGDATTDDDDQGIASSDDIAAQLEFFAEVNRLRGEDIQVDYGDLIPSSVEGMAHRDRAVEARGMDKYEADLKARDPRGAAYLLHRMAGGNDEDFFARKTLVLPDYEMFKEDVNLHRQIYKSGLMRKGLSESNADALVEIAVKSNSLFAEADQEYRNQQQEDQQELARLAQLAQKEAADYQTKIDAFDNMLNTTLSASDLNVVIPDAEQKNFNRFVKEMVQTDGKNFFIAQILEPSTVRAITESLYIQFKKGDLSSVITRKANSLVTKRNQIQLGNTKKTASAAPPPPPETKKQTLGNLKFPGEL